MISKKIKIGEKEISVAYCYATEISFKKLSGFVVSDFDDKNPEHILYLIVSAMQSYYLAKGEEIPVADTYFLYECTSDDLITALSEIVALHHEWYKIPYDKPAERKEQSKKK